VRKQNKRAGAPPLVLTRRGFAAAAAAGGLATATGLACRTAQAQPILPLRRFLLSSESRTFRQALLDIRLPVGLGVATDRGVDPLAHADAAKVVANDLGRWVALNEAEWVGPTNWAGMNIPEGLDALVYRARASELMALGGFFMAARAGDPQQLATDFTRVAFGVDPNSLLLGDFLGGRLLEVGPPRLPPELDKIREFLDRTCVAGIMRAAAHFGQVAANRPRPLAVQITDIEPDHGCAGDVVVIRGVGFGASQPANVAVMFGCSAAQVVRWADTEITVVAPPNVGRGCIGLIEHPSGFGEIVGAAGQFAGELESCLGPVAGPAAGRIRDTAAKMLLAACALCTEPRVEFIGGPPQVKAFSANGRSVSEILPGGDVAVAWQVEDADEVHIVSTHSVLPPVPELPPVFLDSDLSNRRPSW
jgi:IPT/TIG domain